MPEVLPVEYLSIILRRVLINPAINLPEYLPDITDGICVGILKTPAQFWRFSRRNITDGISVRKSAVRLSAEQSTENAIVDSGVTIFAKNSAGAPTKLRNRTLQWVVLPALQSETDDLARIWIVLDFIQHPHFQGKTMEDIGGRYFDVLTKKKSFFDESVIKEGGSFIIWIGVFKYLHSLPSSGKCSNQDHCSTLVKTFPISRSLRLSCMCIDGLGMILEERIGELKNMNELHKLEIHNLENMKEIKAACVGYMGARSTVWINNVNIMLNLEMIKLAYHLE
ncbi:hypothetical protein IEQ34_022077 [Dendrobium chrysotoxum]|uniref:Disease resistance protein winged helix domain-containing protein n=1 Tax=Dendrobium chrysotoxum TaxID=161865 RepID=A0AAV7FXX8_DENCH|nr:hypothetical protein IEQ34_022077 [Dendrobium chrysotoxum]